MRLDLAAELRTRGLHWDPVPGDRFVVPDREMDDEVFVISEVTVEVQQVSTGPVLGFNGTTEWALDSLTLAQVLWLPREEQLRRALGDRFRRLEAVPDGWAVVVDVTGLDDGSTDDGAADGGPDDDRGRERSYVEPDAEDAYAVAVLATLPDPFA